MPKQEDAFERCAQLAAEAAILCRLSAMQHDRLVRITADISESVCRDDPSQRSVMEPLLAQSISGLESSAESLRDLAATMDKVRDSCPTN